MGMRRQAPGWGLPPSSGQAPVCCSTLRVGTPTLGYLEQGRRRRAPLCTGQGQPGTSRGAAAPRAGVARERPPVSAHLVKAEPVSEERVPGRGLATTLGMHRVHTGGHLPAGGSWQARAGGGQHIRAPSAPPIAPICYWNSKACHWRLNYRLE